VLSSHRRSLPPLRLLLPLLRRRPHPPTSLPNLKEVSTSSILQPSTVAVVAVEVQELPTRKPPQLPPLLLPLLPRPVTWGT
jgi:hypothetical protein